MVDEAYTLSYVNIETASGSSLDLTQLQDWSPSPNIQNMLLSGAGELDPTYQSVGSADPVISMTTTQIAGALGEVGILGSLIDRDDADSDPGLEAYLKQLKDGGARLTGGNHVKAQISSGMLVPRQLNATSAGADPATLSLDAIAKYDGVNAPVIFDKDVSMSTTPSATDAWVLGPVIDGSGTDLNASDLTIDWGLNEQKLSDGGEPYPSHVSILKRTPTITLTCHRTSYLADMGLAGRPITGLTIYLKKTKENDTRVADGTTGHIKLEVNEGTLQADPSTFNQGQSAGLSVSVQPTFDGTNDIIAVTTDTTIS